MLRIFGVSLQNCKLFRLFVGFPYPLALGAFLCAEKIGEISFLSYRASVSW